MIGRTYVQDESDAREGRIDRGGEAEAVEEEVAVGEPTCCRRIRLVGYGHSYRYTAPRAREDYHSRDEEGADDVHSSSVAVPASSGPRRDRHSYYSAWDDEDILPAVHHPVQICGEEADGLPANRPIQK